MSDFNRDEKSSLKYKVTIQPICILTSIVFIILKLLGVINWNVFFLLLPIILMIIMNILSLGVFLLLKYIRRHRK